MDLTLSREVNRQGQRNLEPGIVNKQRIICDRRPGSRYINFDDNYGCHAQKLHIESRH